MLLPRSSSSRVLCTSAIARIVHRGNAPELDTLLLLSDVLQFLQACSIALVIRSWLSLHVTTALVVSFLGKLAIELTGFHLTTALIHRFSYHATGRLLCCAERRSREQDQGLRSVFSCDHLLSFTNFEIQILSLYHASRRDQRRWNQRRLFFSLVK